MFVFGSTHATPEVAWDEDEDETSESELSEAWRTWLPAFVGWRAVVRNQVEVEYGDELDHADDKIQRFSGA